MLDPVYSAKDQDAAHEALPGKGFMQEYGAGEDRHRRSQIGKDRLAGDAQLADGIAGKKIGHPFCSGCR